MNPSPVNPETDKQLSTNDLALDRTELAKYSAIADLVGCVNEM
jgi:hypothetical protein